MNKLLVSAVSAALAFCPAAALAGPVFGATSYTSTLTLNGANTTYLAGVAYDGSSYYLGYGNSASSPIVRTNASGTITGGPVAPTPGIDFRSLFSDASGAIYARGYASSVIYRQTSFGVFSSVVTLAGSLDSQEQVVLNSTGTGYIGNNNGVLQFWNLAGALTGTVTLQSFNNIYPQGRAVSILGNYALDYSNGTLFAYSLTTGALVDQTTLVGGGSGFSNNFGQALANGYFFVGNDSGQAVGYRLTAVGAAVPEPATWAMMLAGFGAIGFAMRRRIRRSEARFDAEIKRITDGAAA